MGTEHTLDDLYANFCAPDTAHLNTYDISKIYRIYFFLDNLIMTQILLKYGMLEQKSIY